MLNSEKAFDMLPNVVNIYDKLELDSYRKQLIKDKNEKNLTADDVGVELIKYILKNSGKVKEEFFEIIAISEDKEIEDVKKQSPIQTYDAIKSIVSDKDNVDFFSKVIQ